MVRPVFISLLLISNFAHGEQPVTVAFGDGRVRVEISGRLFTEYIYEGASRPYFYPILAPDGTPLTRDFPMRDTPGEEHDHPWHRALFFAHSFVNGVDFWNEGTGDNGRAPKEKGRILAEGRPTGSGGSIGTILVRDRWLGPDGTLICTDERTLRCGADGDSRFIDLAITIHALPGSPLTFGDNKDGTMAIRLAPWMTMRHKVGKVEKPGMGHIVTAHGIRDGAAWGSRADWCDYYAPHKGKVYGVAIFDHPGNLRHPTWWMARDYGLFAANPFGRHDFENLADVHAGDATVPAGQSLLLRYRFLFHFGDEKAARLAERYAAYAEEN
jgi:hypothetical protein